MLPRLVNGYGRPHSAAVGSLPGSQINSSTQLLTHFIDWIASGAAAPGPVELVLNGDIVDFLLDDDYRDGNPVGPWTPDERVALGRLEFIVRRSRADLARGPFDALADYCRRARERDHSLVLILGNHDLELSLPAVRQHLLGTVLGTDGANVRFVYDGEAYTRGDLLIEHGNRYDRINQVDHSALREHRSAISRGEARRFPDADGFRPPTGSVLVTEVLNPIKSRYRFLDLLKPETEATFPLVLSLDQRMQYPLSALMTFAPAVPRLLAKQNISSRGYLSSSSAPRLQSLRALLDDTLGEEAALFESPPVAALGAGGAWEELTRYKERALEWLRESTSRSLQEGRLTLLRAALRKKACESCFEIGAEREPYLGEARRLADGRFSTVVFGHTHLPKFVQWAGAGERIATYINTGTWADIMRVPQDVLGEGEVADTALRQFLDEVGSNRLEHHITRYLSYARIDMTGREGEELVHQARLFSYRGPSAPEGAPLQEPLPI